MRKVAAQVAETRPRIVGRSEPHDQGQRRDREHRRADAAEAAEDQQLGVALREPGRRGRAGDEQQPAEIDRSLPEAGDQPARRRRGEQAEQREGADHDRRRRRPHAEALGELRQHRGDQAEPDRDQEARRDQDPDLARDPGGGRAAPGAVLPQARSVCLQCRHPAGRLGDLGRLERGLVEAPVLLPPGLAGRRAGCGSGRSTRRCGSAPRGPRPRSRCGSSWSSRRCRARCRTTPAGAPSACRRTGTSHTIRGVAKPGQVAHDLVLQPLGLARRRPASAPSTGSCRTCRSSRA